MSLFRLRFGGHDVDIWLEDLRVAVRDDEAGELADGGVDRSHEVSEIIFRKRPK
jgi:hypothetical protein